MKTHILYKEDGTFIFTTLENYFGNYTREKMSFYTTESAEEALEEVLWWNDITEDKIYIECED